MSERTIQDIFAIALGHHRAGRFSQADALYREILLREAEHAEAWHHLGLLALQSGQHGVAAELIARAAALAPGSAAMQSNLGEALRGVGKLEEAMEAYRRAITLRPNFPEAYCNLGNALQIAGRPMEAIAALRRAVELRETYAEAHQHLGSALKDVGKLEAAAAAFQRAIALRPSNAWVHNSLSEVLKDQGKVDEAMAAIRRVIELRPDFPGAHNNLGNLLSDAGRVEEAIVEYRRAIALRADDGVAHLNLSNALREQNLLAESLQAIQRAAELRPEDPWVYQAMGETQLLMYDVAGAEASFRRCAELNPDSAALWSALGTAMNRLGNFDEAARCFKRALAISPEANAFRRLLSTGHRVGGAKEQEQFEAILRSEGLSGEDRIAAEFALGKLLDENDRFDEAFGHFAEGNRLHKEAAAKRGERFNGNELRRKVDRLMQTKPVQGTFAGIGDSELPVFIVGMPRSGTSLVEQIAASHRDVFGAGELGAIGQIAALQEKSAWTDEAMGRAARGYLAHVRGIGKSAVRVTDKMPDNVFHLGLIASMFPGARVILCRRDGRDNCLSCFFEQFQTRRLLYAYDLADCGRQYLETDRLIEHWLRTLPLKMLEMRYEKLVADQEGESRRLIDFLGLAWDPACLKFHETKRAVLTASVWQVRQPMYTRSVGRWRAYERHLGPLLEMLARTV